MSVRFRGVVIAIVTMAMLAIPAAADQDEQGKLHLAGGSFDPTREEGPKKLPAAEFLPPAAKTFSAHGRYDIVQFTGPVKPEWQTAVRDTGARIVGYIPDFALVAQLTDAEETGVRNLPFVRWVGPFRPAWKVDPDLLSRLNGAGIIPPEWSVVVRPGESVSLVLAAMKRVYPGMEVVKGGEDGAQRVVIRVVPSVAITLLQYILENDGVAWVEPYYERRLSNDESVWVIQSGTRVAGDIGTLEYTNSAPIWRQGIRGTGQIVAYADSGLTDNDCFFSPAPPHQALAATSPITVDLTRRKIIAYNTLPGAQDGDHLGSGTNPCSYHGSHVGGSITGDNSANLASAASAGHNTADGMAPHAKIIMQDIGTLDASSNCSLAGIPNDLHDLFNQAYNGGARIHSNSWGGGATGAYDTESQQVDDFMFNNEYMLTLFAAGNDGPGASTIGSPGTAKNTLTVGATTRGNDNAAQRMAFYSSRGPAADGRIKPDITAPGDSIVSHNGDATACNTATLSGTSMATPTTAGAAILARQYFTDGWYPTGAAVPANGFAPTSAALKAVLTAGARAMTNRNCQTFLCPAGNGTIPASPNNNEGWGRVTLADSLFFSAASVPASNTHLKLWDVPNNAGVTTGVDAEYILQGVVAGTRLHINLVWNDAPGTLGAAKMLVDDLNLEVVAPNGTTIYHGNQWAATAAGQPLESSVGPAAFDDTNNIEGVQIAAPAAGDYRIRVYGFNVPGYPNVYESRQGYAIAATGNFTQSCSLAAPTGLNATTPANNQVALSWTAVPGATGYAIYRSLGGQANCNIAMAQIGQTAGTTYTDTTVQGGLQYSYYVKTLSPCDGPASNCATVTATGNCTLKPTFAGLTTATNAGTASCGLNLSWSAATSNCPLGNSVKYNIYRSTTPNFTPAAGNRIASCVTGTSYSDTGMTSGQTYFYVVRAEDSTTLNGGPCNGGNEETNSVRRSATPLGNTTAVATWTDSDVDTRNQLSLNGSWAIVSNADQAGYAQTGNYAYKTSAGTTNYPDSACASVSTPVLNLAGNTTVTFSERHSAEFQFDGIVVEYSTTGGSSWTKLNGNAMYGGRTFTNAGNACAYATTDSCFQSTANPPQAFTAYAARSFNVTAAAGTNFVVRWTLSSDGAVNDVGFLLDNISVTNVNVPQACVICTTPGVPTGLAASIPANNTIRLTWSAGSPAGATYKVYRSNGACPGGTFTQIASGVSGTTYDDSPLAGGSTFSYKVSAVDITAGCESAQSTCASATATGGPGLYSRGKTTSSRPEDTTSASTSTRWIYSSGAANLTPPGIGSVYAVSNDRVLHGLAGGNINGALWPASFNPWLTNAPSQARPPVPSITIGGSTKEVFLGAQDGNVYAIDANTGSLIWKTPAALGDMVQSAVNGIFTNYGGAFSLLIAPTRNATSANTVYGLNPQTGATAWIFNNGGGASGIGVIAGDPWLDYASVNPPKNKVYFASRKMTGGSGGTVWCLDFTAGSATLCSEPGASWPVALGDVDGGPTLVGNRLYIGDNTGTVYCLNALTGATIWSLPIGDGPIKSFIANDWMDSSLPYRLFLASSTKVTAITDNGASGSTLWSQSIAGPAVPLYDGSHLYIGSTDGKLYELSNLVGPPTVKSVTLGTGAYAVGSPSYDFMNTLIYIGTDAGKLYAVRVPLP